MDEIFSFFARREGITSLHLAALTGNMRLVREVLQRKVDVNVKNIHGETPLHYAAISRSTSAIQLLCETGAFINAQTSMHATPIHYAILA
ncbi:ankyrin repeat protein, partial [Lentithecium fluviatile CBS 122367]